MAKQDKKDQTADLTKDTPIDESGPDIIIEDEITSIAKHVPQETIVSLGEDVFYGTPIDIERPPLPDAEVLNNYIDAKGDTFESMPAVNYTILDVDHLKQAYNENEFKKVITNFINNSSPKRKVILFNQNDETLDEKTLSLIRSNNNVSTKNSKEGVVEKCLEGSHSLKSIITCNVFSNDPSLNGHVVNKIGFARVNTIRVGTYSRSQLSDQTSFAQDTISIKALMETSKEKNIKAFIEFLVRKQKYISNIYDSLSHIGIQTEVKERIPERINEGIRTAQGYRGSSRNYWLEERSTMSEEEKDSFPDDVYLRGGVAASLLKALSTLILINIQDPIAYYFPDGATGIVKTATSVISATGKASKALKQQSDSVIRSFSKIYSEMISKGKTNGEAMSYAMFDTMLQAVPLELAFKKETESAKRKLAASIVSSVVPIIALVSGIAIGMRGTISIKSIENENLPLPEYLAFKQYNTTAVAIGSIISRGASTVASLVSLIMDIMSRMSHHRMEKKVTLKDSEDYSERVARYLEDDILGKIIAQQEDIYKDIVDEFKRAELSWETELDDRLNEKKSFLQRKALAENKSMIYIDSSVILSSIEGSSGQGLSDRIIEKLKKIPSKHHVKFIVQDNGDHISDENIRSLVRINSELNRKVAHFELLIIKPTETSSSPLPNEDLKNAVLRDVRDEGNFVQFIYAGSNRDSLNFFRAMHSYGNDFLSFECPPKDDPEKKPVSCALFRCQFEELIPFLSNRDQSQKSLHRLQHISNKHFIRAGEVSLIIEPEPISLLSVSSSVIVNMIDIKSLTLQGEDKNKIANEIFNSIMDSVKKNILKNQDPKTSDQENNVFLVSADDEITNMLKKKLEEYSKENNVFLSANIKFENFHSPENKFLSPSNIISKTFPTLFNYRIRQFSDDIILQSSALEQQLKINTVLIGRANKSNTLCHVTIEDHIKMIENIEQNPKLYDDSSRNSLFFIEGLKKLKNGLNVFKENGELIEEYSPAQVEIRNSGTQVVDIGFRALNFGMNFAALFKPLIITPLMTGIGALGATTTLVANSYLRGTLRLRDVELFILKFTEMCIKKFSLKGYSHQDSLKLASEALKEYLPNMESDALSPSVNDMLKKSSIALGAISTAMYSALIAYVGSVKSMTEQTLLPPNTTDLYGHLNQSLPYLNPNSFNLSNSVNYTYDPVYGSDIDHERTRLNNFILDFNTGGFFTVTSMFAASQILAALYNKKENDFKILQRKEHEQFLNSSKFDELIETIMDKFPEYEKVNISGINIEGYDINLIQRDQPLSNQTDFPQDEIQNTDVPYEIMNTAWKMSMNELGREAEKIKGGRLNLPSTKVINNLSTLELKKLIQPYQDCKNKHVEGVFYCLAKKLKEANVNSESARLSGLTRPSVSNNTVGTSTGATVNPSTEGQHSQSTSIASGGARPKDKSNARIIPPDHPSDPPGKKSKGTSRWSTKL